MQIVAQEEMRTGLAQATMLRSTKFTDSDARVLSRIIWPRAPVAMSDSSSPRALRELLLCGPMKDSGTIRCAGAIALARAFAHGAALRLRLLHLQHNQIGCPGAIALAASLTMLPMLRECRLERNLIGRAGAAALGDALADAKAAPALASLTLNRQPLSVMQLRRCGAELNLANLGLSETDMSIAAECLRAGGTHKLAHLDLSARGRERGSREGWRKERGWSRGSGTSMPWKIWLQLALGCEVPS